MAKQTEQDMHDSTIYDDLVTSLITLKVILEDIDKISTVIDLEINNKKKQLEEEKVNEVESLEEELRIINYAKNGEIVKIAKIELKLKRLRASKKSISLFKKSVIPRRHLHLVLQTKNKVFNCIYQCICPIILFYLLHTCIFLKVFVNDAYYLNQQE